MNVIRIGPDNVKIELTRDDAERFGLDAENEDLLLSAETARCVKKIMESVRDESGVDFCGERVAIRMFPLKDGGCELFVSRLSSRALEKGESRVDEETAVLRFLTLEDASESAREMDARGGDAFTDSRAIFLSVPQKLISGRGSLVKRRVSFPYVEEYIKEHCIPLYTGDAIERLSAL